MATWRIRLLKTTVRWHFNYQNLNSNWWTRRIFAAIKPDSGELKRRESRTFCRVVSSDLWQMWSMRLVFRWFFVAGYKLATSYISKFISIPSFFNEMFLLRLLIWKFPVEASYFRSFFFLAIPVCKSMSRQGAIPSKAPFATSSSGLSPMPWFFSHPIAH